MADTPQQAGPNPQHVVEEDGGDVEGCLSMLEWKRFVEHVWSSPKTIILHTVILPEGFSPDHPALRNAEVVEEKRYRLPAGVIPQISKRPCNYFEANVAPECNPQTYPVPSRFLVLSGGVSSAAPSRAATHLQYYTEPTMPEEQQPKS